LNLIKCYNDNTIWKVHTIKYQEFPENRQTINGNLNRSEKNNMSAFLNPVIRD